MMFVRTMPMFYGLRFVLGVAEAGFFPGVATWLTVPQRRALEAALAHEEGLKGSTTDGSGRGLAAVLLDPRQLYCSLVFLISQVGLYGVLFYPPAQIAQIMGRNIGLVVGVMSAAPWGCAFFACATIPLWSDRTGERRLIARAA